MPAPTSSSGPPQQSSSIPPPASTSSSSLRAEYPDSAFPPIERRTTVREPGRPPPSIDVPRSTWTSSATNNITSSPRPPLPPNWREITLESSGEQDDLWHSMQQEADMRVISGRVNEFMLVEEETEEDGDGEEETEYYDDEMDEDQSNYCSEDDEAVIVVDSVRVRQPHTRTIPSTPPLTDTPATTADGDRLLTSFWPGLISTRPLNPSPPHAVRPPTLSSLPFESSPSISLSSSDLFASSSSEINEFLADPSSSTSPTSYLSSGMLFTGQQVFIPQKSGSSSRGGTSGGATSGPSATRRSRLDFRSDPASNWSPSPSSSSITYNGSYSLARPRNDSSSQPNATTSSPPPPARSNINVPPLYVSSYTLHAQNRTSTPAQDYRAAQARVAAAAERMPQLIPIDQEEDATIDMGRAYMGASWRMMETARAADGGPPILPVVEVGARFDPDGADFGSEEEQMPMLVPTSPPMPPLERQVSTPARTTSMRELLESVSNNPSRTSLAPHTLPFASYTPAPSSPTLRTRISRMDDRLLGGASASESLIHGRRRLEAIRATFVFNNHSDPASDRIRDQVSGMMNTLRVLEDRLRAFGPPRPAGGPRTRGEPSIEEQAGTSVVANEVAQIAEQLDRARRGIEAREMGRSSSWSERETESLLRLMGQSFLPGGSDTGGERRSSARRSGLNRLAEDEHWAVKVVIQSYSPSTHSLTGLMHALGVPDSSAQVTTFFRGEILRPAIDGLWTKQYGARRKDDADYWSKLGCFKGMQKDDLLKREKDKEWLKRVTDGWILMRWKEEDFLNVVPAESKLSISGFYFIALDRRTGSLEGLYFDQVSSPYQRLILSPATATGGPFSLGTFSVR